MKKILDFSNEAIINGTGKVRQMLTRKRKGIDGLMIAIALVVIGVAIAILFKNSMSNSMNQLLEKATNSLSNILSL